MAKIKRSIPLFESKWSGLMLLSDEEVGCIVKNLIRHANGKDTNVFTNDYIEAMFYILLDDVSTFEEHKEEERERISEYRKKKGNMSTDKNTCHTDKKECTPYKETCTPYKETCTDTELNGTELNGTELNSTERNGTELNCTELNGTDNNILSGKPDDAQALSPTEVKARAVADVIIPYLNELTGMHYKTRTNKTLECIEARINEGFTEADFRTVIWKMVNDWKGTEYEKYLRPETLFSNKFEGYLNRPDKTNEEYAHDKSTESFRALYDWAQRREAERREAQNNDGDGIFRDGSEDTTYLPDFSAC